jgi:DNA-binding SARP family transcriptional activator
MHATVYDVRPVADRATEAPGGATFQVLGAISVRLGDRPVRLRGARHREVLARLLIARGQVVPVDRLIDDLWPQQPPQQALAAVQAFVSQLRRALEPDRVSRAPGRILVTEPPGYALRVDADAVDAWRLERLVRESGALLDAGQAAQARDRADAGLALYRGSAFAEFADAPWARTEADRANEFRLLALERRAQAELLLGRARDVTTELEAHAAAHPLREEAWRLLAMAHYASGRQGDALGVLRRARHTLRDELGVDPGPALQQLEHDVLAQVDHLALDRLGSSLDQLPTSRPARPDGFVGRTAELAALHADCAAAAAGCGGLVLIYGAAGAGKSALVQQLISTMSRQGWQTAVGRCSHGEGTPAGWPWAEILAALSTAHPPAAELAEPLHRLLSQDSTPAPVAGDPAVARFRLHQAVGTYLADVARHRPTLVVLDDLHDADNETLALLARLAPELTDEPVLLITTLRDGEGSDRLSGVLAELARQLPRRLHLTGLDDQSVGELVRAICTRPVDEQTITSVARRTGGNPFFVIETARLLEAEGTAVASTAVPVGVRDVLARRIDRLPDIARTMLNHAAVIGPRIDVDVLTELAGGDADAVLEGIESALLAGLVVEPDVGRLEFAHALVRDVLYERLSRLRRARLHTQVATALERRHPTEVAALAYHFVAAGSTNPAATSRYCWLAAEEAEARLAHREAATLWRQSLAAWKHAAIDARERLQLMLRMVRALALSGDLVTARAYREEAVQAARALSDPALTARVIVSFDVPTLWTNRRYGTVATEIIELTEQTLRQLPAGDGELRARLLVTLAMELEGEPGERGRQAAAEAEAMARRLGNPDVLVMALNGVFMQHYFGELVRREKAATEMLELAQRHELSGAEVLARLVLSQAHVKRADFAAADAHVERVEELARRYDRPLILALVAFYHGLRHVVADRLDEAEAAYREAVERLGQVGQWSSEQGLAAYISFSLRLAAGRFDEATQILAAHRATGGIVPSELHALALARAGHLDEAAAVAGAPEPIRRDYYYDIVLAARGHLGIVLNDSTRAQQAYIELTPFADLLIGGGTASVAMGPVAQVLGELAEHFGQPGEARAHYRQAAKIAIRAGAPRWAAQARAALDRCAEQPLNASSRVAVQSRAAR